MKPPKEGEMRGKWQNKLLIWNHRKKGRWEKNDKTNSLYETTERRKDERKMTKQTPHMTPSKEGEMRGKWQNKVLIWNHRKKERWEENDKINSSYETTERRRDERKMTKKISSYETTVREMRGKWQNKLLIWNHRKKERWEENDKTNSSYETPKEGEMRGKRQNKLLIWHHRKKERWGEHDKTLLIWNHRKKDRWEENDKTNSSYETTERRRDKGKMTKQTPHMKPPKEGEMMGKWQNKLLIWNHRKKVRLEVNDKTNSSYETTERRRDEGKNDKTNSSYESTERRRDAGKMTKLTPHMKPPKEGEKRGKWQN